MSQLAMKVKLKPDKRQMQQPLITRVIFLL